VSTPLHFDIRHVFAGAADIDVYVPPAAQNSWTITELFLSTDAAAELVLYEGFAAADNADGQRIRAGFFAANGGASPYLGCSHRPADKPGTHIRLHASAACTVHVQGEGWFD